jgi:thiamine-monophosphate kinase
MDKELFLIGQFHSKYIGDDGAVLGEMVYSMDAFFEDTHFRRSWMTPAQIGRKAMLVNLSDAIAMNAVPLYAMASVAIPKDFSTEEICDLTQSLEATAQEFGCEIIGGDTIGGEKLHISIALISKSSAPLFRKGLKEGDILAFTGALGESKRDLERLMRGETIQSDSRFYEPKLRSAFIAESREYLRVGMDISDGLFCDTNKLVDYNDTGFEPLIEIPDEIGASGEEYEMLIGFAPENMSKIMQIAEHHGVPVTPFAKAARNQNRFPCESHHFKSDLS